ncbi:MAG: hypothetical protein JO261_01005, partial [Alphaproteobacteria bacterium]|nr:hypothetical protein [Alphaproteobacteria bacterium]
SLLGAAEPDHAFNAADFVVPADELDAAAVGEAAVHAGFLPLSESDPTLQAMRAAPDATYEIWELPSHRVARITLTRMAGTGKYVVLFVAKDQSTPRHPLSGEACKRWLKFSGAMRIAFARQSGKYRFRNPQCTP